MSAYVSLHNVLIPYISGLSFGAVGAVLFHAATRGLNPLYLGAIFRGQQQEHTETQNDVLIPYISGLSFGENTNDLLNEFSRSLNPLYLGAIFRGYQTRSSSSWRWWS